MDEGGLVSVLLRGYLGEEEMKEVANASECEW